MTRPIITNERTGPPPNASGDDTPLRAADALVFAPGEQIGDFEVVARHGASDSVRRYVVAPREDGATAARGLLKTARFPCSWLSGERLTALSRLLGRTHAVVVDPIVAERAALAACDHPGIPPLLGRGQHRGQPWIVLPLYEQWQPLTGALPTLSLAQRVAVVGALWSALAHMGRRGVVHRDLKLSNLLVTPDLAASPAAGQAFPIRVIDFETALTAGAGIPGATGTAAYRSPEQWSADHLCQIEDTRTDLFAFGVLSSALLTQERPVRSTSGPSITAHWRERLRALPPALAESALAREIAGLVSLDRTERQDASARFPRALKEAWTGISSAALPWLDDSDAPAHEVSPSLPDGVRLALASLGVDPDDAAGRALRRRWRAAGLSSEHESASWVTLSRWAGSNASDGPSELRRHWLARSAAAVWTHCERTAESDPRGLSLPSRAWALATLGQPKKASACLKAALDRGLPPAELVVAGAAWRALGEDAPPDAIEHTVTAPEGDALGQLEILLDLGAFRAAIARCVVSANRADPACSLMAGRALLATGVAVERLVSGQTASAHARDVFSSAALGAVVASLIEDGRPWLDAVLRGETSDHPWMRAAELVAERARAHEGEEPTIAYVELLVHAAALASGDRRARAVLDRHPGPGSLLCGVLLSRLPTPSSRRKLAVSWGLMQLGLAPLALRRWRHHLGSAEPGSEDTATFDHVLALAHALGEDVDAPGAPEWHGSLATAAERHAWYAALQTERGFDAAFARSQEAVRTVMVPTLFIATPDPVDMAWIAACWLDALARFERWDTAEAFLALLGTHRPALVSALRRRLTASGRGRQTARPSRAPDEARLDGRRVEAAAELEAGRFVAALRLLASNLEERPESALDWLDVAAVSHRMGDMERCADAALKAVQHRPDLVGAWIYLLRAHRERATRPPPWLLLEVLRRFPSQGEIVSHAAAMLIAAGEPEAARDATARLLEVDPTDATAWSHHVIALTHMGDAAGALGAIDRANRVASLERLVDPSGGDGTALTAAVATTLLRGEPGHRGALSMLLSACARTGRYEDARVFGVELLGRDPSWHEQLLLALALTGLGDLQSAQGLAELWYLRWGSDPSLAELKARLDVSPEEEPATLSLVVSAGLVEAARSGAWDDVSMWTDHIVHIVGEREHERRAETRRRIESWLATQGRPRPGILHAQPDDETP